MISTKIGTCQQIFETCKEMWLSKERQSAQFFVRKMIIKRRRRRRKKKKKN